MTSPPKSTGAGERLQGFYHGLLEAADGSPFQAARAVATLPYDHGLRKVFRDAENLHAENLGKLPDASTSTSTNPRSQPGILRGLSSKAKLRLGQEPGPPSTSTTHPHLPSSDHRTVSSPGIAQAPARTLPVAPARNASRSVNASSTPTASSSSRPPPYRCVFCPFIPSGTGAKGSIKRHLRDQHVAPQKWHCYCHAVLDNAAKAKRHDRECPQAQAQPCKEARITLKVYACEFTGKCFDSSQNSYVEHLVELSAMHPSRLPTSSLRTKLAAILTGNSRLAVLASEASTQICGAPDTWRSVVWDEQTLKRALGGFESGSLQLSPRRTKDNNAVRSLLSDMIAPARFVPAPDVILPPTPVIDTAPITHSYQDPQGADTYPTAIQPDNLMPDSYYQLGPETSWHWPGPTNLISPPSTSKRPIVDRNVAVASFYDERHTKPMSLDESQMDQASLTSAGRFTEDTASLQTLTTATTVTTGDYPASMISSSSAMDMRMGEYRGLDNFDVYNTDDPAAYSLEPGDNLHPLSFPGDEPLPNFYYGNDSYKPEYTFDSRGSWQLNGPKLAEKSQVTSAPADMSGDMLPSGYGNMREGAANFYNSGDPAAYF